MKSVRYVTRRGDTLWYLANQFYGDPLRWTEIYHANPWISDPTLLHTGLTLTIPSVIPSLQFIPEDPVVCASTTEEIVADLQAIRDNLA